MQNQILLEHQEAETSSFSKTLNCYWARSHTGNGSPLIEGELKVLVAHFDTE